LIQRKKSFDYRSKYILCWAPDEADRSSQTPLKWGFIIYVGDCALDQSSRLGSFEFGDTEEVYTSAECPETLAANAITLPTGLDRLNAAGMMQQRVLNAREGSDPHFLTQGFREVH